MVFAALLAVSSISAATAHAGLIGDTITVSSTGSAIDSIDVVVNGGIIPEVDSSFSNLIIGEFFNIQNESIIGHFEPPAFENPQFFTFSDLDWQNGPGEIVGFNLISDSAGFGPDLISFTSDSVTIDVSGLAVLVDFVIELETVHTVVPEPTSLAIFGLGALGLVAGGIRRRRQK